MSNSVYHYRYTLRTIIVVKQKHDRLNKFIIINHILYAIFGHDFVVVYVKKSFCGNNIHINMIITIFCHIIIYAFL